MTAIKVYGPPNFSCVARVLVTLYEKNVENFELVSVNTFKGEHKTPEFLKLQVRTCVDLAELLLFWAVVKRGPETI